MKFFYKLLFLSLIIFSCASNSALIKNELKDKKPTKELLLPKEVTESNFVKNVDTIKNEEKIKISYDEKDMDLISPRVDILNKSYLREVNFKINLDIEDEVNVFNQKNGKQINNSKNKNSSNNNMNKKQKLKEYSQDHETINNDSIDSISKNDNKDNHDDKQLLEK